MRTSFSGNVTDGQIFTQVLSGSLDLSSNIVRNIYFNISGIISPTSALIKKVFLDFSGALSLTSTFLVGLDDLFYASIAGALSFGGSLIAEYTRLIDVYIYGPSDEATITTLDDDRF